MAEFNLWLLIVGLVVGAVATWLAIGTMARQDEDVAAAERAAEAAWIASAIEDEGASAPVELVARVLLLHRRYLQGSGTAPAPEAAPEATEATPKPTEATPKPSDAPGGVPTESTDDAGA